MVQITQNELDLETEEMLRLMSRPTDLFTGADKPSPLSSVEAKGAAFIPHSTYPLPFVAAAPPIIGPAHARKMLDVVGFLPRGWKVPPPAEWPAIRGDEALNNECIEGFQLLVELAELRERYIRLQPSLRGHYSGARQKSANKLAQKVQGGRS